MTTSKVSDNVYLIDTLAVGERNTVAAYLVKGTKFALIDCGYASSAPVVLDALGELNVTPSQIDYIIPTHVHLDHAGAAGHLLEKMPKAKVIAQERGVPHLVDPTRLVQSATTVFGEELIRMYGAPKNIDPGKITPVGEEMHIDLGGVSLTAIHAPGHAPHQISVNVEEDKVLVAADAVGIVYPSLGVLMPTTPPPSLNPEELGRTTEKLSQLDSEILAAPHFGVRNDVKYVLAETKTRTNDWISRARVMKKGGATSEEMAASFKAEITAESGVPDSEFPVYGDISIRTNVMGIMRYLEKNP
jgi:glyoxylase-like metal-dependent hydrolase (beta-lactamase superfamily II)